MREKKTSCLLFFKPMVLCSKARREEEEAKMVALRASLDKDEAHRLADQERKRYLVKAKRGKEMMANSFVFFFFAVPSRSCWLTSKP